MNRINVFAALAAVSAVALLSGATAANAAQNLIVNGDFAAGSSGWTRTGFGVIVAANGFDGFNFPAANMAAFGDPALTSTLSQAIAGATPGEKLTLSFDFASDGGTPSLLQTSWDGNVIGSISNSPAVNFVAETFVVTANGTNDVLSFKGGDPGWNAIADFSLTAVAGVPEPASWGLMLMGFAIVGAAVRCKPVGTALA